jgi:hypothetical protein
MSLQDSNDTTGVALVPLQAPIAATAGGLPSTVGSLLTPAKQLRVYGDELWEEFILEWAVALGTEYESVMGTGGANDRGVDIAGFVSAAKGFDGEWDCYQCKHYKDALTPTDAWPEILKIVVGVMDGAFTWPRKYFFVASRGVGPTLKGYLNSGDRLRKAVLVRLNEKGLTDIETDQTLADVIAKVGALDFSNFSALEPHVILAQHARTQWHSVRFGLPLPARTAHDPPPQQVVTSEQLYVRKLLDVYDERYVGEQFTPPAALSDPRTREHLRRQREAFFSAEALREFASESVPDGTFERLQDDMWEAVVETCDGAYSSGWTRLTSVLQQAVLAPLSNDLMPRVDPLDRRGLCHRLANEDRLGWCEN